MQPFYHEKLVKSFKELEEILIKKDSEIEDLKSENINLKSELETLKYQLDLKEKRNQSYFGLNKELKELRESEMWQTGAAVRALRPENWKK